ncbi:hypothetical protein FE391_10005 [Nonomuraea sp. KC401]|uniref:hypothetical protein n=1 Tax=unclassified Nonomuraea TaxID=2593643 RepID=UPI0010FF21D6|nr:MULTISPECIES: hypothetical protein [unclassified Nonomuraea]NBF00558.1 hypothetical protein [Nonomuraea sp. K271]TLF78989.1 hypothetical protein FE391_10005 [Nonomuraea sp. KC401]
MRSTLIATGGALAAAAVVFGAGAATAASGHNPRHCDLAVNEDSTYHHVTEHGRFAGTRDIDACVPGRHHHHHDWRGNPDRDERSWVFDWLRR